MGLEEYRPSKLLKAADRVDVYHATSEKRAESVELWMLDRVFRDPESKQEFRNRIRLAAYLQNPFVDSILDYSVDEPPFFAVTRPRTWESLRDRFAGEVPLAAPQIVTLMRGLLEALAAAHRLGLVHGRIRPETIGIDGGVRVVLRFDGLESLLEERKTPPSSYDAPERPDEPVSTPAHDLFAAGSLLAWLLTGTPDAATNLSSTIPSLEVGPQQATLPQFLRALAIELRSPNPEDCPSAQDALNRLNAAMAQGADAALQATRVNVVEPFAATNPREQPLPPQLGRFRLTDKIGEGGMGVVYRAEDTINGSVVAIKVLNAALAANPRALRRFEKEARMLAFVRSPNVANLLEVNEDAGIHYLAMEFVAGRTLSALLAERGKLDESSALSMIADVCRALAEAHRRGVVHRDIKPDNILLAEDPASGATVVKLTDFGLARQVEQSESLDLTRENVVGTPLYMAPEQGLGGGQIDARTDVYALGATLFHLLAGEPPFLGESPAAVLRMHANDPLPSIQRLNPAISDGASRLIERAMSKQPTERFADANTMLAEIERLLRGEPSSVALHPLLPNVDPARVQTFEFRWQLKSSPEQLWPFVSNTERLNRAIGLPAIEFTNRLDNARVRRFGKARKIGLEAEWEEHPFEWIEGRRMGVLRVMQRGPFEWLSSVVELAPRADGGTNLTHRFQLAPRNLLGRIVAKVEIGGRTGKALGRVYQAADEVIRRRKPGVLDDPFEQGRGLNSRQRNRLQRGLAEIEKSGAVPAVVERFGEFLESAADQEVARIRPLAVAESLALDSSQFVNVCLQAAHEGLLVMLWDILCPICRIPSQIQDSLRTIKEHGRCEACNLDFDLDFANSVELIFRAHREVRATELGVYCIGGPSHSPHVAAQVRVAAGERMDLAMSLTEGQYRLRGPQLPYAIDFRVTPNARNSTSELVLSRRPVAGKTPTMATGAQTISLINDTSQELVVRVERTAPRTNALTAARAASLPLFRELFPNETLAPGQLVGISQVTLLVTELENVSKLYRELGDAAAFARIHEHIRLLEDVIRREGGAVVKTVQGGVVATFNDAVSALRAAIEMPRTLSRSNDTKDLVIRCGVHRGPAYTATINDRLDYFGTTVSVAISLPGAANGRGIAMTRVVATDPEAREYLQERNIRLDLSECDDLGLAESFIYRAAPLAS
jgi:serine/threonine protein kinase/class 3 adenylate cyclase